MIDYTNYLNTWLDITTRDYFKRACANPYAAMYLYYKPNNGGIYIGENPLNDEWILASSERIGSGWDMPKTRRFIENTLKSLPIF